MIKQNIISFNNGVVTPSVINNDIALIQCFWGADLKRLSNAVECIRHFLLSRESIKDWIIVEAQRSEDQALLKWVQMFGIKYVFNAFSERTDGIFLKMPLWNIGVQHTDCNQLCFTDMDVYFQDADWTNEVGKALGQYDVISLHKTIQSPVDPTAAYQSIGYAIMNADITGKLEHGHGGHTLGMTRQAYETFGKFDAVNYLDDQWFWQKLTGRKAIPPGYFISPYRIYSGYDDGYPLKVGSTSLTAFHIRHDDEAPIARYKLAQSFSYATCKKPMEDIQYDKQTLELPTWSDTKCGKLMQKCFMDLFAGKADDDTLITHSKEIYGAIDDGHPLVIITMFYPDYMHKDSSCVVKFKQNLEAHCVDPFTFVCFSTEDIPGIDCLLFERDSDLSKAELVQKYILDNDRVQYPENSTKVYLDIDYKFGENMLFMQNDDISIYM